MWTKNISPSILVIYSLLPASPISPEFSYPGMLRFIPVLLKISFFSLLLHSHKQFINFSSMVTSPTKSVFLWFSLYTFLDGIPSNCGWYCICKQKVFLNTVLDFKIILEANKFLSFQLQISHCYGASWGPFYSFYAK